MDIRGMQKLSLTDFPGKVSSILFLSGCNFRCPYCHNPELINSIKSLPEIPKEEALSFLSSRVGWIESVVLSGGEPTIHDDLVDFIREVKSLDLLVKLDTNGSRPDVLRRLISENLLDYVSMDIKAPLEDYSKVSYNETQNIENSIKIITSSGISHEFRSTVLPRMHTREDIVKMAELLKGGQMLILQNFNPGKTLDPEYINEKPFRKKELESIAEKCSEFLPTKVR